MSDISKITGAASGAELSATLNNTVDAVNGFSISFATNELNASVIKGDDIISLTSDPTNTQGVVIITSSALTYKGSDNTVKHIVKSSAITDIVQISQSDYDALVSGGTVDANTFYVIV